VYIENPDKKALQGDKIETPEFIAENDDVKINYSFYITNQLMKPIQQVFALVLEKLPQFRKAKGQGTLSKWKRELRILREKYPDDITYNKKLEELRGKEVKLVLFDKYLIQIRNKYDGNQSLLSFGNVKR